MTGWEREFEVRAWHSLCSLERLLSVLTGRPSALQDRFVSVRLPRIIESSFAPRSSLIASLDVQEGQDATTLSYTTQDAEGLVTTSCDTFVASLHLDAIIAEAMADLYGSRAVNISWARLQNLVSDLDTKLNQWWCNLAPELLVPPNQIGIGLHPLSERMYLCLRFFGARMLINRPCLCEVREVNSAIPSPSETSSRMDAEAARRCISAARGLLQLLPQNVNSIELYNSSPWWCVLHYLIQAGVVLMMEILFNAPHMPAEIDILITESGIVLRWLSALSATSVPAQRAWVSLSRLLRLALAKAGKDPGILTLYMAPDASLPISPSQSPAAARTPLSAPPFLLSSTPIAPIFHTPQSDFLFD
jgi:hypothetical protein